MEAAKGRNWAVEPHGIMLSGVGCLIDGSSIG
jgi:hypothetical protein